MIEQTKRPFWRFGGKLDTIYNWILVIFFVLDFLVQYPRLRLLPESLGAAFAQTIGMAIILFVIFKLISVLKRS